MVIYVLHRVYTILIHIYKNNNSIGTATNIIIKPGKRKNMVELEHRIIRIAYMENILSEM